MRILPAALVAIAVAAGPDGAVCAAGCGDLDWYGACVDGGVRWCDGGEVHVLACQADQACGWRDDTIGNDCV